MIKRLLCAAAAFILGISAADAQEVFPQGFELDTVAVVREKGLVNDYSVVGVNFGPTISRLFMNPSGNRQTWLYNPWYVSVTYIKNMKMFGFLPYFGYQIGIAYGHEGYKFKPNKETGYLHQIEGASEASMSVVEIPLLLHGHMDWSHFKIMVNVGPYVGYRLGITRKGESVTPGLENSFASYDYRLDYGIYGGAGFALVFDPIEIHFNAIGHMWSWGSIYAPDSTPGSYSKYYYRFAYPFDINFTAGIYFQLGKRYGKTTRQIKKEAYDIVYGEDKR